MKKLLSTLLILMFVSPSLHALACVSLASSDHVQETRPSCHTPAQAHEQNKPSSSPVTVEAQSSECIFCGAQLCEDRDVFIQSTPKATISTLLDQDFVATELMASQALGGLAQIRPPTSRQNKALTVLELLHSQSYRGVYLN